MKRRQELEQKLIEKVIKDEAFKKKLIENPKEALKNEFGVNFPESFEIKIIEEEAKKIYRYRRLGIPSFDTFEPWKQEKFSAV